MKKDLKNIILSIIILLLLVSSSIFYIALKKSANDIKGLRQRNTELEKENQELKDKLPPGWKEYIDDKNGFKVWYPAQVLGYKISIQEKDANNISFILDDQFSSALGDTPTIFFNMHMYSKNEPSINKIIREELKEKSTNNPDIDINEYLNNIEKYITQEKTNGIDSYRTEIPENNISYFIKKYNLIYALHFNNQIYFPGEETDTLKSYFEQTAKSFKLAE